jgi:hypothetical protein
VQQAETMASVSAMTATQVLTAAERRQVRRQVRSVFGRYDAAGDGFVDESDLVNLLRDLTGKEPNKIDLQFALKAMDLSGDGRVSFDEMVKYWEANVVGHGGSKFNKLLVKDRVGAPRTSTYDLPPLTHKFGKPAVEREFGTKESALAVSCVLLRAACCVLRAAFAVAASSLSVVLFPVLVFDCVLGCSSFLVLVRMLSVCLPAPCCSSFA